MRTLLDRSTPKLGLAALILFSIGGAIWLAGQRTEKPPPPTAQIQPKKSRNKPEPELPRWTTTLTADIDSPNSPDPEPVEQPTDYPPGTIRGEVVLQFNDAAAMQEAVRRLTEAGVPLHRSIRSLNMLRVGVPSGGSTHRLGQLLEGIETRTSFNRRVDLPQPIEMPAGAGALRPFGNDWIEALGVTEDISNWGSGVRIAVVDTGVTSHPALDGARINRIPMVDGSIPGGHGNAVTSVIVGNGEPGQPRGLAPAAEILAYQALGPEGGDSFTVAESIVDATDRGASIINLSLGGFGDSEAVRQAVRYAQDAGAVLVAAVGNERLDRITYPAAYHGVIAVTSVDAEFHWAEYPNVGIEGKPPDIAGPGVGIPAAYEDDLNIAFSGTSTAAPAVTAAIAAEMSLTGASAREAAAQVLANASDRGEPGPDPFFGAGYLDLGRVRRADTPGVIDLAISDNFADLANASDEGLPVRIGIQNRGTETVSRPRLSVMIGHRTNVQEIALQPLAPGEVTEYVAFIPAEYLQTRSGAQLGAVVTSDQGEEFSSENNALATSYSLPEMDGE